MQGRPYFANYQPFHLGESVALDEACAFVVACVFVVLGLGGRCRPVVPYDDVGHVLALAIE